MTALTIPAQPGQGTGAVLRPVPYRRMAWVTWRQHRPTLISVPAVLGVVALYLLVAGLRIHDDFAALTACRPAGSAACNALARSFTNTDWTISNVTLILMNLAPVLIGAFAGAPVLARELETGTFRYAWTQAMRRERQAMVKLVLLAAVVTGTAGALGELFAWFFQPALQNAQMTVLAATVFATRGLAFAGWALVAFAIGAFLGMLFRRIIPAMAATLGVYLVLALAAWDLRKYYPVALVTSNSNLFGGPGTSNSPWVLATWYTGPGGKPASQAVINQIQSSPGPKVSLPPGYTEWTKYIPVSHFWSMQFIEAGWLLVLSVLLLAATVRLVRRRAA